METAKHPHVSAESSGSQFHWGVTSFCRQSKLPHATSTRGWEENSICAWCVPVNGVMPAAACPQHSQVSKRCRFADSSTSRLLKSPVGAGCTSC